MSRIPFLSEELKIFLFVINEDEIGQDEHGARHIDVRDIEDREIDEREVDEIPYIMKRDSVDQISCSACAQKDKDDAQR